MIIILLLLLILIIIPSQGAVTCTLSSNQPVLQDFLVVSLKRISLKDEDIVVKKLALTQDWHQGLGGGGAGRDFSRGWLL